MVDQKCSRLSDLEVQAHDVNLLVGHSHAVPDVEVEKVQTREGAPLLDAHSQHPRHRRHSCRSLEVAVPVDCGDVTLLLHCLRFIVALRFVDAVGLDMQNESS